MSELEKTAPNEIYLIVGDADKDCNFNELAEVTWADKPVYEETAIKYVKSSQLTIPKSIADEFDQIYEDTEEYQTNVAQMFSSMQHYFVLESYPKILHWLEDDVKNTNVVLAYLAGKALGVDLVKVV
ncbi:gliding motility-associated lipoprotein GldB, gldB [Lactococcus cremoris]|nr:gliding motility-associated lipoprotein GldB, gldB [Lactococcus cremoris]